jgi:hypothetical protein
VKSRKKYWQEVKKMTTKLYIGDHVFNLESLIFGYKIYDQAYFDLSGLIVHAGGLQFTCTIAVLLFPILIVVRFIF